jgi:hypothetical protein
MIALCLRFDTIVKSKNLGVLESQVTRNFELPFINLFFNHRKDQLSLHLLNPLNVQSNPICHLLALLGAHPILHVSRIRVKSELRFIVQDYYGDVLSSGILHRSRNVGTEFPLYGDIAQASRPHLHRGEMI